MHAKWARLLTNTLSSTHERGRGFLPLFKVKAFNCQVSKIKQLQLRDNTMLGGLSYVMECMVLISLNLAMVAKTFVIVSSWQNQCMHAKWPRLLTNTLISMHGRGREFLPLFKVKAFNCQVSKLQLRDNTMLGGTSYIMEHMVLVSLNLAMVAKTFVIVSSWQNQCMHGKWPRLLTNTLSNTHERGRGFLPLFKVKAFSFQVSKIKRLQLRDNTMLGGTMYVMEHMVLISLNIAMAGTRWKWQNILFYSVIKLKTDACT